MRDLDATRSLRGCWSATSLLLPSHLQCRSSAVPAHTTRPSSWCPAAGAVRDVTGARAAAAAPKADPAHTRHPRPSASSELGCTSEFSHGETAVHVLPHQHALSTSRAPSPYEGMCMLYFWLYGACRVRKSNQSLAHGLILIEHACSYHRLKHA